jgi:hypothetical protein
MVMTTVVLQLSSGSLVVGDQTVDREELVVFLHDSQLLSHFPRCQTSFNLRQYCLVESFALERRLAFSTLDARVNLIYFYSHVLLDNRDAKQSTCWVLLLLLLIAASSCSPPEQRSSLSAWVVQ